jgi:hypothetical protein
MVAVPARDNIDALSLEMLRSLLDEKKWDIKAAGVDALAAEVAKLVLDNGASLVCIAAVQPGSLAHVRYLCKQLRRRVPQLQIVVGLWGQMGATQRSIMRLREAGADHVKTTVLGMRNHLKAWLPALREQKPDPSEPQEILSNLNGRHDDCKVQSLGSRRLTSTSGEEETA